MNLKDLEILAHEAVGMPYGCGDIVLANDPDSSVAYNRFMYYVVKVYKLWRIVELGTYRGVCAAHMALANKDAKVVCVDKDAHPSFHLMSIHFRNMTLVTGDTIKKAQLTADLVGGPIELLFIDSTHDGITPLAEFEAYKPFFADTCLVVCDDIELNADMQLFWEQLPGEKMKLNFLHPPYNDDYPLSGFGVSIVRSNA